jgi:glycosyltransferase involved in cell wall biosynthesis
MQAWQRAMLGLAPSIWPEPCATVVLEAMACGKPMIATNMGGNPDMVGHDQTGLLVPAQDPAALARAMQQLIDNPALRERMGIAAREKVKSFQAGTVIPRIEAIYHSLIEARRTDRPAAMSKISAAEGAGKMREDGTS